METEEVTYNPLSLSLDDMIELNKYRNRQQQAEPTTIQEHIELNRQRNLQLQSRPGSSTSLEIDQISLTNGHSNEDLSSSSIRSNSPPRSRFSRSNSPPRARSVHERLGPFPTRAALTRFRGKTVIQSQALRAIRNAQQFKRRGPIRGVNNNLFNNNMMGPPLTTNVLRNHNRRNGNFEIVRKSTGASSVSSVSTVRSSRAFFRHSTKKCLNENTQKVLQMLRDGNPATVTSQDGKILVIPHTKQPNFKARVDTTPLPTCVRFILND